MERDGRRRRRLGLRRSRAHVRAGRGDARTTERVEPALGALARRPPARSGGARILGRRGRRRRTPARSLHGTRRPYRGRDAGGLKPRREMKMKRGTLTLLLLAATCGVARAQETQDEKPRDVLARVASEEKRRDIVRLLELTKAADLGTQVIQQMMGSMRANFATLPSETREKVFKTFEEELTK